MFKLMVDDLSQSSENITAPYNVALVVVAH